jgi:hypothetical protein
MVACNLNPTEWRKNGSVVDHLLSLQQADGSFNYSTFQRSNPGYMTASAIIALLGKPFPLKPTEYFSLNESLSKPVQKPTQTPTPTPKISKPTLTPTPTPTLTPALTPTPAPARTPTPSKAPGFELPLLIGILAALSLRRRT